MNTLHLTLKAQWYNMIEQGIKKEEYRDIKPYWAHHFVAIDGMKQTREYWTMDEDLDFLADATNRPHTGYGVIQYDAVCFHYGYTKRTMTFKIKDISIGTGKPEWGAEEGKKYFVIKLGERLI